MKQPDYTAAIHVRENSSINESHLNSNRQKFTGQTAIIISLLQKGIRLTSRSAMIQYGIGHLPRRVKDIRDNLKVHIDEEWELDSSGKVTRNKVWFMKNPGNLYAEGTKTVADFAKEMINATQAKLL